jgi:drug/metabolite transporter (DMT)-like permease
MTSVTPVATTAVTWVVLPEDRPSPVSLVGLFVSFVGAVLLVSVSGPLTLTAALLGKALLVVGVGGLAVGSVLVRWAPKTVPSTAQTGWAALVGAIVIHVLSHFSGEQWTIAEVTPTGVAAVTYLAVGATAVAYVLFFDLLDRHPAIEVTLVTYVVPVIGALTGWLLFEERLTARMAAAFALILVGFLLMKRRELRETLQRWYDGPYAAMLDPSRGDD